MKQQELERILEEKFIIISSLEKNEAGWSLFDCNGERLRTPDKNSYFPSSMYGRYANKTKIDFYNDVSRVWALIGITNDDIVSWIQVGRSKNRSNMLSDDIKDDIKDFLFSDELNGKYGKHRKSFRTMVFLEVNIKKYLGKDDIFYKTFGVVSEKNVFSPAYYCLLAAYVEGKLAYEKKAEMYIPSTLDGYFYKVMNS